MKGFPTRLCCNTVSWLKYRTSLDLTLVSRHALLCSVITSEWLNTFLYLCYICSCIHVHLVYTCHGSSHCWLNCNVVCLALCASTKIVVLAYYCVYFSREKMAGMHEVSPQSKGVSCISLFFVNGTGLYHKPQ